MVGTNSYLHDVQQSRSLLFDRPSISTGKMDIRQPKRGAFGQPPCGSSVASFGSEAEPSLCLRPFPPPERSRVVLVTLSVQLSPTQGEGGQVGRGSRLSCTKRQLIFESSLFLCPKSALNSGALDEEFSSSVGPTGCCPNCRAAFFLRYM